MIGDKSCMFNIEKKTSVGQKLIYEDKFENLYLGACDLHRT